MCFLFGGARGLNLGASARLACFLLCTLCAATQSSARTSYIIKVAPGKLPEVAQQYRSQGLIVVDTQAQHNYLVVQQPAASDDKAVAAASTDASSAAQGNSLSWPEYSHRNITPDGVIRDPRDSPSYQIPTPRHATAAQAAAVQATKTKLASQQHVLQVEESQKMYLVRDRHHRGLLQQNPGYKNEVIGRMGRAVLQANSSSSGSKPASCPAPATSVNIDSSCGKSGTECVPYGIKMVQADDWSIIDISKRLKDKVLFCVIDTGLDPTSDFESATTTGCSLNGVHPDGSPMDCQFNWWEDTEGHGTHVSGTIGARRNGRAVVGVSAEGAQIYHYNAFGPNDSFESFRMVNAWYDCVNELTARQQQIPDMKMIISMSFGAPGYPAIIAEAVQKIASSRKDVLFIAAAGNSGPGTQLFPAIMPEVVSVGAVDPWNAIAGFSATNEDVEWVAPGTATLSTYPTAYAPTSSYNMLVTIGLSPFTAPGDYQNVLSTPPPRILTGSALGTVTGELVDCGLGDFACTNAMGKVCLIQRGGSTFCSKLNNCIAGGGKGAIFYNSADANVRDCDIFSGTLIAPGCALLGGMALSVTRLQGTLFRNALRASNGVITATLSTGSGDILPVEFLSATSMATPHAAGVAGLVWSAFTGCTADEIRDAISKSAQDVSTPGRDPTYGFGVVKAVAAVNYLLTNPCNGAPPQSPPSLPTPSMSPSPPPAVNCIGEWSQFGPCVRPGTNEVVDCGGGVQVSTYIVAQEAANGGSACEALNGTTRSQSCNNQTCLVAADDEVTAVSGQWTVLDTIFNNDAGDIASADVTTSPVHGSTRSKTVPHSARAFNESLHRSISYLSAPGYVGTDSFRYTVTDTFGERRSATVSIRVLPGSCQLSSCTVYGRCNTATGACECQANLESEFIPNPVPAARSSIPRIPACQFRSVVVIDPARAVARSQSVLTLNLPVSCIQGRLINRLVFRLVNEGICTSSQVPTNTPLLSDSTSDVGNFACTSSRYTQVVRIPRNPGCYPVIVTLADNTKRVSYMQVGNES